MLPILDGRNSNWIPIGLLLLGILLVSVVPSSGCKEPAEQPKPKPAETVPDGIYKFKVMRTASDGKLYIEFCDTPTECWISELVNTDPRIQVRNHLTDNRITVTFSVGGTTALFQGRPLRQKKY